MNKHLILALAALVPLGSAVACNRAETKDNTQRAAATLRTAAARAGDQLSDSWLAASAATRSVGGWLSNFGDWYWTFVRSTLAYLAVAALVHALATQWLGALPAADATRSVQH